MLRRMERQRHLLHQETRAHRTQSPTWQRVETTRPFELRYYDTAFFVKTQDVRMTGGEGCDKPRENDWQRL